MSEFRATIIIDAGDSTRSIFESVEADSRFQPEVETKTVMNYDGQIRATVTSGQVQHLRAGLNSLLRMVQASHDTIESLKI